MSKEAFEKWADEKGQTLTFRKHIGQYESTSTQLMWVGWQARQPEIDAKDKTIDGLALQKGILKAQVGRLESEIDALKAEVERLGNEREKVINQSGRNDALLFENAQLAGRLMKYEEPGKYAAYCKALEDKIAAMKETK